MNKIYKTKKALVIYHANCDDGFGAAWAFHYWQEKLYDSTQYYPGKYGEDLPLYLADADTDVFILDFSYRLPALNFAATKVASILQLDHHKSALLDFEKDKLGIALEKNLTVHFDMTRSGAMLAWNAFKDMNISTPAIITHIQDNDLWKFENKNTKNYIAALRSYKQSMSVWDELVKKQVNFTNYLSFITEGEAIRRYFDQQVASVLAATKHPITIDGVLGLAANLPPVFASDAGNTLAKESGTFGCVYFIDSKGMVSVSLRSIGDFDVSLIAKKFGGGGHKNAAGYKTAYEIFP